MTENNETKFPIIETERLRLRNIRLSDNQELYEIFSSEEIMKYYGMHPIEEISDAETLVNNFRKGFEEGRTIRWGIELKTENKLIGTCGFHNWNKANRRAEIGYELLKKHWRQGYVKEAITGIIKHGFDYLSLNRIEAVVYPENIPSQNSLINLGFLREGLLRQYAFHRNKEQDLFMYSLLKQEYNDSSKA